MKTRKKTIHNNNHKTWIQALREHNRNKPSWCIPRRGSADHILVRAIMRGEKTQAQKASMLTKGEKTYQTSISAIEHREKVKAWARRIRPLTRRGL